MWMKDDPHNDYVNDSQMYKRKIPNQPEKWLGVVRGFMGDIQGQNHHVYCDNFFLSVKLFEVLLQNVAYACGTIRKHGRVLWKVITSAILKEPGDLIERHKGNLVATAWYDKCSLKTKDSGTPQCIMSKSNKKSTLSTWMAWTVQTSAE